MSCKYILSLIIYCVCFVTEGLGELSVRLVVKVNGVAVSDEGNSGKTVNFDVDDTLDFSCNGSNAAFVKYYYSVVHEQDGIKNSIPEEGGYENNFFSYILKADYFDNATEIHCVVEIWNMANKEFDLVYNSASTTLIMNADKNLNFTIRGVYYSEDNPAKHICESGKHIVMVNQTRREIKFEELPLAPAESNSVLYCSEISRNTVNGSLTYSRNIYNQNKYIYTNNIFNKTRIGIGVGVVTVMVCIILVAGLVRYRSKKNRPDTSMVQDIEPNASSTQMIYAELVLAEAPCHSSQSQGKEESPYAEIAGFYARK